MRIHHVKSGDVLIGMGIGASASKRMWPAERFSELGLWLRDTFGARVLAVGGPGEEELGAILARDLGSSVLNAVGQATLRQTALLQKCCRLFVGNDTGTMHMAAAVGVPVIELSCHPRSGDVWSANSPLRFGPWGVRHIVLQPGSAQPNCVIECVADRPHCILHITVEQAKRAILQHLAWMHTPAASQRDSYDLNTVPLEFYPQLGLYSGETDAPELK